MNMLTGGPSTRSGSLFSMRRSCRSVPGEEAAFACGCAVVPCSIGTRICIGKLQVRFAQPKSAGKPQRVATFGVDTIALLQTNVLFSFAPGLAILEGVPRCIPGMMNQLHLERYLEERTLFIVSVRG